MNIESLQKLFPNLENEMYEELLLHGTVKEIKPGETLFRVGQIIRSAILILEGSIKLYREDNEGKEFFIYSLKGGQACILSFVCSTEHKQSEVFAKALTSCVVLSIPIDYINKWIRDHKSWYQFIMTSFHNRFEDLLKTLDAVAFSNMDKRLEFYLRKQSIELGLNLKLTHHKIASDLNSSREVISRLLKKMEARNFLILHRNSIEILNNNVDS